MSSPAFSVYGTTFSFLLCGSCFMTCYSRGKCRYRERPLTRAHKESGQVSILDLKWAIKTTRGFQRSLGNFLCVQRNKCCEFVQKLAKEKEKR